MNDTDSRFERLYSFLYGRRSVRRFLPQPVPREVFDRILEAATWAPSAHNRQPWRFAVLIGLEAKTRLADRMGREFYQDLLADGLPLGKVEAQVERSRQRILEAPAVVLLCLDSSLGDVYPDAERQQAEYLMDVQGVAMAGGTMLLAAHAEGLGGVWMCAPLFAPVAALRALDLPVEWKPQALILLGYPAKIPPRLPRRPVSEVTLFF